MPHLTIFYLFLVHYLIQAKPDNEYELILIYKLLELYALKIARPHEQFQVFAKYILNLIAASGLNNWEFHCKLLAAVFIKQILLTVLMLHAEALRFSLAKQKLSSRCILFYIVTIITSTTKGSLELGHHGEKRE